LEEFIMENNEIMEIEEMNIMEGEIIDDGPSGMSTGAAMLAGAALTVAVAGVVKLGKRVWGKIKARKEEQASKHDFAEVVSDDDDEVVTK
jgi:hypothetical protein